MSRSTRQRAHHAGFVGEEIAGGVDGQAEHLGDVLIAPRDFQRLRVVARAVAGRAGRIDARQKQQFDADEAFAFARRAAALRDVEREAARAVAPLAGAAACRRTACARGRRGRCRWRGWSAACGRSASDRRARAVASRPCLRRCGRPSARVAAASSGSCSSSSGLSMTSSEPARDQFRQRLAHEARFARARHARHGSQAAERKRDVQPMQIVARDVGEPQPAGRRRASRARPARAARTDAGASATLRRSRVPRAARYRPHDRRLRRPPDRHRPASRRAASSADRARRRTANCPPPSGPAAR